MVRERDPRMLYLAKVLLKYIDNREMCFRLKNLSNFETFLRNILDNGSLARKKKKSKLRNGEVMVKQLVRTTRYV